MQGIGIASIYIPVKRALTRIGCNKICLVCLFPIAIPIADCKSTTLAVINIKVNSLVLRKSL